MNPVLVNPYIRSAAFFPWKIRNVVRNVSYHMRFFAFRKQPAVLLIRDTEIQVPAESLLILRAGVPYDFRNVDAGRQFDLYCCNFDLTQTYRDTVPFRGPVHEPDFRPEYIVDPVSELPELAEPLILTECPELCRQVQTIYELYTEETEYGAEICSGIIKTVLFQALRKKAVAENEDASHGAAIAARTMQYIRQHFAEPINEQSIAAAMNFHPYYLTRLTRRYYGTTPYRYLLQCRCTYARQLLLYTDMSIGDVAAASGFLSQSHFTRVITRQTGYSPGRLRKMEREEGGGAV